MLFSVGHHKDPRNDSSFSEFELSLLHVKAGRMRWASPFYLRHNREKPDIKCITSNRSIPGLRSTKRIPSANELIAVRKKLRSSGTISPQMRRITPSILDTLHTILKMTSIITRKGALGQHSSDIPAQCDDGPQKVASIEQACR